MFPPMRGDQLARQWQLIQRLARSRGGLLLDDLATELGCVRRTVYRDLNALMYAGFPVLSERRDSRVYYRFVDSYRLGDVPFTPDELLALAFGEDLLRPLEGCPQRRARLFMIALENFPHAGIAVCFCQDLDAKTGRLARADVAHPREASVHQSLEHIGSDVELLKKLAIILALLLGDRGNDRILGRKMAIECAGAHVGLRADLLHRRAVKSLGRKTTQGGRQHALPRRHEYLRILTASRVTRKLRFIRIP